MGTIRSRERFSPPRAHLLSSPAVAIHTLWLSLILICVCIYYRCGEMCNYFPTEFRLSISAVSNESTHTHTHHFHSHPVYLYGNFGITTIYAVGLMSLLLLPFFTTAIFDSLVLVAGKFVFFFQMSTIPDANKSERQKRAKGWHPPRQINAWRNCKFANELPVEIMKLHATRPCSFSASFGIKY